MIQTARVRNKDVTSELDFNASKSGGPGGQNVNKVNSKITLRFDVKNSQLLTEEEKEKISDKLSSRISNDGILIINAQSKRTQLQNKEAAIIKFNQLMGKAFARKKFRKATKPTKSSVKKRLNEKKKHSEKKKLRQNIF
ncbi:alternative ribosome rescue aminoacyl-tRNA hydrolase ArfB [Nafulsella turpanensis]|uniref:alternative ribosome rescue aminoacyl-tRNA hydrolase ArfB n=1 Tax=Nafulsella turpanensis TaxID=1265690 RepID=UPI0003496B19|nr:alternative ribosome rescue aminoacyl-tRNA hydrolase ArfB [Nafulsella turpanensis]